MIRRFRTLSPLLLGTTLLLGAPVLFSCSAKSQRSAVNATEPTSASDGANPREWELLRKEEIRTAWDKIGELRQDPMLGLSREPAMPLSAVATVSELRQCVEGVEGVEGVDDGNDSDDSNDAEEPDVTAECSDVCNIKDAICDNTEDICRIADELGGDVWATDKCDSAKASCKEAKEICCGCIQPS